MVGASDLLLKLQSENPQSAHECLLNPRNPEAVSPLRRFEPRTKRDLPEKTSPSILLGAQLSGAAAADVHHSDGAHVIERLRVAGASCTRKPTNLLRNGRQH